MQEELFLGKYSILTIEGRAEGWTCRYCFVLMPSSKRHFLLQCWSFSWISSCQGYPNYFHSLRKFSRTLREQRVPDSNAVSETGCPN
jgi:hypothetical protein